MRLKEYGDKVSGVRLPKVSHYSSCSLSHQLSRGEEISSEEWVSPGG